MEVSGLSGKLPPLLILILLTLLANVDVTKGQSQGRVCYWSTYYRRYTCYPTQPLVATPTSTCTSAQQTGYYAQSSYNTCCGSQASVTKGTCCQYRYNYYGRYYNYCMCSYGATCSTGVNPPTTTTTSTTTTTPTTTTTTPTTTTTTPTTTTTTPTTTTTTPTTTTTTPTTTTTTPTTTTTTPTTTPPKKLCPAYRLLNSQAAKECDYPGITSIERVFSGTTGTTTSTISACNAVLVPANINGVTKPAFFTSKMCKDTLNNLAIKGKTQFNFKIANRAFPVDVGSMFDIVDDPSKGSSFFVVKDRFASLFDFTGTCQNPACVMTLSMVGQIDFSDCEVVSYGASDSGSLDQTGLRKVKVHITINDACAPQPESFGEVNSMCFTTTSGKNLLCSNDMGAAVFCRAKSQEKILIGSAAFQRICDSSPHFRILPYPVTKLTPVPVLG